MASLKKIMMKVGEHRKARSLELPAIGPDGLRDRVLAAFSKLSYDERAVMRDRLLAGLAQAGVRLGPCVLLLGIAAQTVDEMTPPDIAMLLRYVQINQPEAIRALAEPLDELLASGFESAKPVKPSRRAA